MKNNFYELASLMAQVFIMLGIGIGLQLFNIELSAIAGFIIVYVIYILSNRKALFGIVDNACTANDTQQTNFQK